MRMSRRASGIRCLITARSSYTKTRRGQSLLARMQNSVASPESGRAVTCRPRDLRRESAVLEHVAAKRIVATMQVSDDSRLSSGVGAADHPVEFARPPPGAIRGPIRVLCARQRPSRRDRRNGRSIAANQPGCAAASSSRNATISPVANAIPVFLAPDEPRSLVLGTTRTPG